MNKQPTQNIAASVHQRLLNIAKQTERPFDEVLQYFAMERFLYRISISQYAESFILKGALLFRIWHGLDSRATRDIDFLAYMDNTPKLLAQVIGETCAIECADDGLVFDAESVDAKLIKKDADYQGVRVRFRAYLGKARIVMQTDVGFGDIVHPDVTQSDYPTLLDLPAPSVRIYSPESVIAEKSEAMVQLGSLNSRMKDFYDIWRMSRQFDFDGATLSEALRCTFENRGTSMVEFAELKPELQESPNMEKQWQAFLRNAQIEEPATFANVLETIDEFLAPVFASIKNDLLLSDHWAAPGPWRRA